LVGVAYRAHNPRWAWSPLSGEGARLHGGRFNRAGDAALYLSLETETAICEASQGFAARFPPLTLITYDVDCEDIVDLNDDAERARRGIEMADLSCPWLALLLDGKVVPSHGVADRLIDAGAAGAIVPSFAPSAAVDARNLVLWRWGPDLPWKVTVYDPDNRLPSDGSSWR